MRREGLGETQKGNKSRKGKRKVEYGWEWEKKKRKVLKSVKKG